MKGLLMHACSVLNYLSTNIFHLSLWNKFRCAIFLKIKGIITDHQMKHMLLQRVSQASNNIRTWNQRI